jgi:lipoprotein-anchoring transpeptidase ErfK/SrfK
MAVGRSARLRACGAALVVVAVALTAACSGGPQWRPGGTSGSPGAPGATGSPGPGASALSIKPAANAKNVSPTGDISVNIAAGTLTKVTLTNSGGKAVKGEFGADHASWKVAEELGYDKTYKLAVEAQGADGKQYSQSSKFTTVKPKNMTLPYLRANYLANLDGGTFGVGQPVVVWFDEPVRDKAAAQKALSITTNPPVEGAWHWFDSREVHWRPKAYWPTGTKVTVKANVYGVNLGGGLYGQQDVAASFKIGASHILKADAKTHRMKVYFDGKLVTKINGKDVTKGVPVSMGKDGTTTGSKGETIDFRTYSGPHVVMAKFESYRMRSCSFGICDKSSPNFYDQTILKSIRISSQGEFVHLADWNIWAHGNTNTSHGCINVAPTYIYWIYNQLRAGDVVEVTNTGKKLDARDGVADFVIPWKDWIKGSAIPYEPPTSSSGSDTEATPSPTPSVGPTG